MPQLNIKDEIVKSFEQKVGGISDSLNEYLMKLLDEFDSSNGEFIPTQISPDKLYQIQTDLERLLNGSLSEPVKLFMSDLGKVTLNSLEVLNNNGFNGLTPTQLSVTEKLWRQATIDSLIGGGISRDFKNRIITTIEDAIITGSSIQSTRDALQEVAYDKLNKYLTVTARDTVYNMQGQQFNQVGTIMGYTHIKYTGGLLENSRGQCYKWYNMRELKREDLKALIEEAYRNQRNKLESPKGHKWSGMMKNVTPENFIAKRGGYGCTHTATPIIKRKM